MKRLKLNLDQLGEELEMLDPEHLHSIKGGTGSYGGYNSWEELWAAMQNGYVPPEGEYNPGGYGDYGWGDYGGYNGGWPDWYGGGYGDYGTGGYGNYGGYSGGQIDYSNLNHSRLFHYYPRNEDGSNATPSSDSYAANQCAIRLGKMFMDAYGVDFSQDPTYAGNVTSEGYPRGARDVAEWLIENGVGHTSTMTRAEFLSSSYYSTTGIVYQIAEDGSMAHIDIYSGNGETETGFYSNQNLIFFPIAGDDWNP
ncbi:T6SS effector amidase Tae4 family protein [Sphingobacterium pedocola]|uniref:Peptidase C39-like domain-containing protein n=1 Tax=Sphingobacterium pedocola TaxID=2082722 RepID=A0ABR9T7R1_9SPHI|nr:T6SS effector amidase Tae4 family protein [Sphingobacterium pedocola]MBE8721370.1 hypothetical protein [Sphingobacterium pedocola]